MAIGVLLRPSSDMILTVNTLITANHYAIRLVAVLTTVGWPAKVSINITEGK